MSPKTGRPKTENAKVHMLHIRMNDDDLKILNHCCDQLKKDK